MFKNNKQNFKNENKVQYYMKTCNKNFRDRNVSAWKVRLILDRMFSVLALAAWIKVRTAYTKGGGQTVISHQTFNHAQIVWTP